MSLVFDILHFLNIISTIIFYSLLKSLVRLSLETNSLTASFFSNIITFAFSQLSLFVNRIKILRFFVFLLRDNISLFSFNKLSWPELGLWMFCENNFLKTGVC